MSVTSGFFNSLNGDRRYNAEQMSAIFDGIINDGVFANIGTAFAVKADSGNNIKVGIGRAWFNSAWIYNDAILPMTLDDSEVLLHRYDAVVIEIDHSDLVRTGAIKIVKGTPASSPKRPEMVHTGDVHQYPLAFIYRGGGTTEVTQAVITNMIGTSSCPYVTGILEVVSIDNIIAQWENQWSQWTQEEKENFVSWFNELQAILSEDVAANLSMQLLKLEEKVNYMHSDRIISLSADAWSSELPYTQTVNVTGIKETDVVKIYPNTPKDLSASALKLRRKLTAMITDVESGNGYITFYCGIKKPTADFSVLAEGAGEENG